MTPEAQKEIDIALKRLAIEDETDLKLELVKNPSAYELYCTWKYFDNLYNRQENLTRRRGNRE
jgi:hypothetical protein